MTLLFAMASLFVLSYFSSAAPQGFIQVYWRRYVCFIENRLQRLFSPITAETFAKGHVLIVCLLTILALATTLPYWYMVPIVVAFLPSLYLDHECQKRVQRIDKQVDGFMLALANALKTTPSLGDAIKSVENLIHEPLCQELQLALKEIRLGSSLDEALLLMAARVESQQLESALSAILIGRQVGGNLTKILESTAASLREMNRLEGVVRSKTAEGKTQLLVLAAFPIVICLLLKLLSPNYLDPLTSSWAGYVLVFISALCWIGSLVLGRKITDVDI
ncbi:type II secretion system F family protein [Pajaroellobacter abortibovis]|nr:type II secretion system F family protein [Pajaroellobacter abortibovis]